MICRRTEVADVIHLHWLTVDLGRLLWPVSSAQPVDGGWCLHMCRAAVHWHSPGWRRNTVPNQTSHSSIEFSPTANLTTYTIWSLFSLQVEPAPHLLSLAWPSVSSSLRITNRSFTYASPYLWYQLPSSFRQPHCVHSPPGSPHPVHITSSQSPLSLSSPITPSTFHSRLTGKTHLFQ